MKKRLTKVAIGDEKFEIPTKDACAVLQLVETIDKSANEGNLVPWDKVFKNNFGNIPQGAVALKGARGLKNWNQEDLANTTGISKQNISHYERGTRKITENVAKKFAKALNKSYRIFLK